MVRPHTSAVRRSRRGVIMIVVLALLALFAVVGISFVFYADSQATTARIYREAQGQGGSAGGYVAPPDATDAANSFLGSFVFGTADSGADLLNAVRGHDLARGVFGWGGVAGLSNSPFSGVGTFHENTAFGIDRAQVVNFTAPGSDGGNAVILDPEWMGFRQPSSAAPTLANTQGRTYIPKNAPYTYPDTNNLFLASISPATGEVLVPSFHRNWLFPLTPPNVTGGNGDWTNPAGRAKTLRPRPIDQLAPGETASDLPTLIATGQVITYPPQNADGSYTGDVQNMLGHVGPQRNDSILMDIGKQPFLWNNKWIKPLVAVLVTDLDGSLNYNIHGNLRNSGTHSSYAGYGPWEVNLFTALGADANTLISSRQAGGNPSSRSGKVSLPYDPSSVTGTALPVSGLVNWDATGGGAPTLPGPTAGMYFQTAPTYPAGFTDGVNQNPGQANSHPGLWNPNDWPEPTGTSAPGTPFAYPVSDLRRLRFGYAGPLDRYQQMGLRMYSSAPVNSLVGTSPAGPGYRLDPAHPNRLLVTPRSASLDLPGILPNFPSTPGILQLTTTPGVFTHPINAAFNTPYAPNMATVNPGPIDLNRPLTDYRNDTTQPPGPGNNGNYLQAWADRHNLARDIFARLIVATGANATVDGAGNVTINATPGNPDFNALRYLAQVAVNAVDYIDKDDVSTAFVWNTNAAAPGGVLTAVDSTSVQTMAAGITAATLPNQMVFGVEKPRLVINEAYGEVANDPNEKTTDMTDKPSKPAHVRFWVELLNPTSTPYAGGSGPLGTGAAQVRYDAGQGDAATFNPYRLIITQSTGAMRTYLQDPTNVTGGLNLPAGTAPNIDYDFQNANPNANASRIVQPNGGAYGPNLTPAQGCLLVGPQMPPTPMMPGGTGPQPFEFNPPVTGMNAAAPWNQMIQSAQQNAAPAANTPQYAMEYLLATVPDTSTNGLPVNFAQHLILLRRAANPYLQPNDPADASYNAANPLNPYITVDYMDYVPAFDALNRGQMDTMTARTQKNGSPPTGDGYDPVGFRFSVGKVQPYTAVSAATAPAANNTLPSGSYSFPTSFVLAQSPANFAPATSGVPANTFGQHNGKNAAAPGATTYAAGPPATISDTIMLPFDWLVHWDRPLANSLELLQLQAVKPHELTQYFLHNNGGTIQRGSGQVPWFGVNPGTGLPNFDSNGYPIPVSPMQTNNGLFRALDLLRVKPWGYGIGLGGRVPGRININTIQDQRVLQALLDPQAGNYFTGTEANNAWANWMTSRTPTIQNRNLANGTAVPVPFPGQTVEEGGADRPFKPFTVAELVSSGSPAVAAGSGIQDTLLRMPAGGGMPLLWVANGNTTHPYQQAEMARKLINNTTTVSNCFAVSMTVVFHEVRTNASGPISVPENGTTRYLLGKEAYLNVPGDLRQQYFAVVDRTHIGLVPNTTNFQAWPFFTSLEATAMNGTNQIQIAGVMNGTNGVVLTDGQVVQVNGNSLAIGTGANVEYVGATGATAGPNGTIFVNLAGVLQKPHYAGECVSSVMPGNPGPQTSFDILTATPGTSNYRFVVPYAAKIVR